MINWAWYGSNNPKERAFLSKWAAEIIWPGGRDLRYFGEQLCLAVADGTELIAVVVYHNYEPEAGVIEMSGAAKTEGLRYWMSYDVLREMYRYPFEECGVQLVVHRVASDNKRLLRLLGRLGFDFYEIPRLRGRGKNEMVCTLSDDAYQDNEIFRKVQERGQPFGSAAA